MPLAHGLFRGTCRGGPWDGKYFDHDRPEYRVAVLPPLSLRLEPDPPAAVTLKWGTYRHVLHQWIWRKDADR